jgi:predicted nucleic acid-binding protein
VPDGQIAAIARAHDMSIVTRNIRDFSDCGLQVINPFDYIASLNHS